MVGYKKLLLNYIPEVTKVLKALAKTFRAENDNLLAVTGKTLHSASVNFWHFLVYSAEKKQLLMKTKTDLGRAVVGFGATVLLLLI